MVSGAYFVGMAICTPLASLTFLSQCDASSERKRIFHCAGAGLVSFLSAGAWLHPGVKVDKTTRPATFMAVDIFITSGSGTKDLDLCREKFCCAFRRLSNDRRCLTGGDPGPLMSGPRGVTGPAATLCKVLAPAMMRGP